VFYHVTRGEIVMELIVYTTYLTAMRHPSQTLAASGGARPAAAGRAGEPNWAAGVRRLLGAILIRLHPRHGDPDQLPAVPGGTITPALTSHH
jgi:hypothetical protein